MKQGQGLVRFITIAMFLICAYYLSFSVVGWMFTKAENEYVAKNTSHLKAVSTDSLKQVERYYRTNFRDSFTEKPFLDLWITSYDYKSINQNQLNLGLDLKGGMSFVLEVNQGDILKALSNNSKDPIFNKAIDQAIQAQANSQDNFPSLLLKAYNDIDPNASMAPIFATNQKYADKIKSGDKNEAVLKVLDGDINSAVNQTYNVIKSRINQFGVAEPVVTLQEGAGRIIVELPGADDLARVKKMLQSSAKLEFWHVYDNREIAKGLEAVNETLKGLASLEAKKESPTTAVRDTTKKDTAATGASAILNKLGAATNAKTDSAKNNVNPLYDLFMPNYDRNTGQYSKGPSLGMAHRKDLDKISQMLAKEEVQKDLKGDIKFLWSAQPVDKAGRIYELYAIKASTQDAPLTGDVMTSAMPGMDDKGQQGVDMVMNSAGAAIWERMTAFAANGDPNFPNKSIAIVMDNVVFSAPSVGGPISGGKSQISGSFTAQDAKDLANILNSGKIDAPAKIIQEEVVGPTLGQKTIKSGMISLLVGLLLILAYMFLLFRGPGLVADICLLVNLFFLLGVLSSINATMTLPGIAGIVLIIGAAVDANVIIFERIKEEMRSGKGYWDSVAAGYKHSYWTIIDANVTTLITSLTLMFFGYGPIKGFAFTLTFGILTSLFTAVLLTREVFNIKHAKKEEIKFVESFYDKYFVNSNFQFIKNKKYAYAFSIFFIVVGFASIFTRGFDLGVDFIGGRSYVVTFDKDVDAPKIKEVLANGFDKNIVVKTFGQPNQVQITTAYLYGKAGETQETAKKNDETVLNEIYKGVQSFYTISPSESDFETKYVSNFRKIDAAIADDIKNSALWVSIIALLGIFAYVWFRFDKWQFSIGAIAALIHDLFFTLGVLSLLKDVMPFSLEFNQSVIAAILTIIGFSTNDTVVIFDRIREFRKKFPTEEFSKTINDAINATLSRTVMTASTLLIVSLVLFFFGGESLRGFSFTMVIGVIIGTLSSIFVASPVALDFIHLFDKGGKEVKKK
ncbi:MAG: protein translocase subunit SecDF [Chitinophagales bacterium]|jgi:SecD/SecF fusion protein|nr:protein translocase subunit SecDF [Sphingobacteriales bacterium]